MEFCTARFIARRNMMRFSSCWQMFSATNLASNSGLRISSTANCTPTPLICASSKRRRSMSSPFLPMTMPGRAVYSVMFKFCDGRSMTMRLSAAFANLRVM